MHPEAIPVDPRMVAGCRICSFNLPPRSVTEAEFCNAVLYATQVCRALRCVSMHHSLGAWDSRVAFPDLSERSSKIPETLKQDLYKHVCMFIFSRSADVLGILIQKPMNIWRPETGYSQFTRHLLHSIAILLTFLEYVYVAILFQNT